MKAKILSLVSSLLALATFIFLVVNMSRISLISFYDIIYPAVLLVYLVMDSIKLIKGYDNSALKIGSWLFIVGIVLGFIVIYSSPTGLAGLKQAVFGMGIGILGVVGGMVSNIAGFVIYYKDERQ